MRNTKNYMKLPYNPRLKEFARANRKSRNLPEVLLWMELRNKNFKGLDFDRQKIIGNYIVDFFCANCMVVIEVDGISHSHKAEYDAKRDKYLKSLGLKVIHIPVRRIMQELEDVMEALHCHPAFDKLD